MTSSARAGSPGFTLLEMIISLFIIMLILGMAIHSARNLMGDEELRDAAKELRLFAKTTRKQAMDSNQTQEALLDSGSWKLLQNDGSPAPAGKKGGYVLPEDVTWKVKKWGSDQWETPKEISWFFSPTGLCVPLRFRLERKESWMEFSFNPLTANSQDEGFYLP